MKNKYLITIALLFLITTVFAASMFTPEKTYKEGVKISTIDINSFNNKFAQTKDEIMKKPYVLIEFFTLRCPHCKNNIKHLNELNKNGRISVVGYINANSKKVRAYARENGVEFTLSRSTREHMKTFNPVAVPMSFLIDTKTLIVKKSFIGKLTKAEVLSNLK